MTSTTYETSDDFEKSGMFARAIAVVARVITFFIYAYVIIVEIILLFGFFLLLFGANPQSGFVEWIYRGVERAMRPFRGIFAPIELGTTGNEVPSVLDTSVLFAMIMYGIGCLLLASLLHWLSDRIHRIDRTNESERAYYIAEQSRRAAAAAQMPPATPVPAAPVAPSPVTPQDPT